MGPKDLQLIDGTVFKATQIPVKITKILWVMDPARLKKIDPGVMAGLSRLNLEYDLRTAKARAELEQAELDLYEGVKTLTHGG